MATPKHMEQQILTYPEKHVDMSEGGLYTSTQLKDFTRLVTYPKVRKAVKHNMISTVCTNNPHKLCPDFNGAFGTVKPADVVSVFNLRSTILGFIHNFGEAAAALIGVYFVVREALKKNVESVSMLIPRGGGSTSQWSHLLRFFLYAPNLIVWF